MRKLLLTTVSLLFLYPLIPQAALAQRVVTCESQRGRTARCPIDTSNGIRLIRQLSGASCEGNWEYSDNGYVIVRNGCRGEFEAIRANNNPNNNQRVTCESYRGNSSRCPINTRNGVRLVRQLSGSSCEGNWYYSDDGYVVVSNGCRGEFEAITSSNSNNNQRYQRFRNVPNIGTFIVDRFSYYDSDSVREFDAIVNGERQKWWANCRNDTLGINNRRASRNSSTSEIIDFVCTDESNN